jgi:protein transport protein SEC24
MILPVLTTDENIRMMNMIHKIYELRKCQNSCYPNVYLVKEDSDMGLRHYFLSNLVEDRFENIPSYHQFLSLTREEVGKINPA